MTELSFQYMLEVNDQPDHANQFASLIFDGHCQFTAENKGFSTGLELLSPSYCYEQIYSSSPIIKTATDKLVTAHSDHFLWAISWADESAFSNLVEATEFVYSQLLNLVADAGFPYLVRVWNYFERINQEEAGLERYKQFCIGRFNAFRLSGLDEESFPAACALGHSGGQLVVYLLAAKTRPIHFENPNQQSAYFYPSVYGPRSPSFARASAVAIDDAHSLVFVSGTASVTGHKTVHSYDVENQLIVTFNNLDALEQQIQHLLDYPCSLTPRLLKVYIRHMADLDQIKHAIEQRYPDVSTVYLKADICRADLMLEIDGIWSLLRT